MLHEVILALLGHPGSIIQETKEPNAAHGLSNTTFRVQDSITFLAATERDAINRLVGVGSTYRDLRRFVRPQPLNWAADASSPHKKDLSDSNGEGLYIRALKLGVEELLDEYSRRIAQVESDVMSDPTSTLARVHAAIRESESGTNYCSEMDLLCLGYSMGKPDTLVLVGSVGANDIRLLINKMRTMAQFVSGDEILLCQVKSVSGLAQLVREDLGCVQQLLEACAPDHDIMMMTLLPAVAGGYQTVLPAVAETCACVMGDDNSPPLKGAQVLQLLFDRSQYGTPDVRRRLCRILWHCSQVLINQCISWLLHGLLVDPYQEFFIQKNKDPIASAGGSAASRSEMSTSGSGLIDDADAFSITSTMRHGMGGESAGAGVVESANVSWRAEEEWNSTYTLRLAMVPSTFVPHGLALKMLFVGKVVRVLRQAKPCDRPAHGRSEGWPSGHTKGFSPAAEPSSESGRFGLMSSPRVEGGCEAETNVGVSEAEVLELTRRWTELRSRETFHLLSLERAVHQAHSLIDRRLYRLLMNISGLERHLANLKGLFLMGHGALFHSFFDKAREAMYSTAADRAVLDLNTWLAAAVEDQDTEENSHPHSRSGSSMFGRDKEMDEGPSAPATMDIARLDLDPPGFTYTTFHDLARQGFCLTGKAVSTNNTVCLCPGDSKGGGISRSKTSCSTALSGPALSSGSLWYTSGREVARGFSTTIAFRCDRSQPRVPSASRLSTPTQDVAGVDQGRDQGRPGEDGETSGCIGFIVHNHRAALAGDESRGGAAEAVSNGLSVCLHLDGTGGGEISLRWNPHRAPLLHLPVKEADFKPTKLSVDPLNRPVNEADSNPAEPEDDVNSPMPQTEAATEDLLSSKFPSRGERVRILGRTALPPTHQLHLNQVHYLMVNYTPRTLGRRGRRGETRDSKTESTLSVFLNNPGGSGSPALSVNLDLWTRVEMGGGRAFVGLSAEGSWRTTVRQWELHTGVTGAVGKGKGNEGPLGELGSGPKVEEMVAAMDSWSGLLLHYRLEWPLHLVLTQETMQTYNRLFQVVAKVKRANMELERVWPTLMQSRYRCLPNKENSWLGPLWMLRARMAFFISNLAFYLQVDVIEAEYSVLQRTLAGLEDFVTLQRAHHQFLSTLRAKFYLDNLEISQGIGRALRHVLRFCCLFSLHGNAKDIDVKEVELLHDAFQDEMALLFPVLERLAKELAMRLDFNGHFSAQVLHLHLHQDCAV